MSDMMLDSPVPRTEQRAINNVEIPTSVFDETITYGSQGQIVGKKKVPTRLQGEEDK